MSDCVCCVADEDGVEEEEEEVMECGEADGVEEEMEQDMHRPALEEMDMNVRNSEILPTILSLSLSACV